MDEIQVALELKVSLIPVLDSEKSVRVESVIHACFRLGKVKMEWS